MASPVLTFTDGHVPEGCPATPDIDPGDGGRELDGSRQQSERMEQATVATVLTKLQKWGDYPAWGEVVQNTKFIPMKTPLSEEILANWATAEGPRHRLTVREMLAAQTQAGREVGMILDLSNHDCLYTSDIPPGLLYEHIKLVAKELPPPEFVTEVCIAAAAFWKNHPDKYIAIHCAYGFNRTGFVLCCYLVEQLGLSVDQALDAFRTARPPGVKHQEFRAELRSRYEPHSAAPPATTTSTAAAHPKPPLPNPRPAPSTSAEEDVTTPLPRKLAAAALARWHSASDNQAEDGQYPDGDSGETVRVAVQLGGSRQPSDYLDCTPEGQVQHKATPMSENDSLGANDRFILQGLRANQQAAGNQQLTPSQLDGRLAAVGPSPPSTTGTPIPRSPHNPALQRKSLGDIDWGVEGAEPVRSASKSSHGALAHRQLPEEEAEAGPCSLSQKLQAVKLG